MKRNVRHKFTVESRIKKFKPGNKVIIRADPSSQKALPPLKYTGASGVVKSVRGEAYIVIIRVGNKEKEIITRPEHLRPVR